MKLRTTCSEVQATNYSWSQHGSVRIVGWTIQDSFFLLIREYRSAFNPMSEKTSFKLYKCNLSRSRSQYWRWCTYFTCPQREMDERLKYFIPPNILRSKFALVIELHIFQEVLIIVRKGHIFNYNEFHHKQWIFDNNANYLVELGFLKP